MIDAWALLATGHAEAVEELLVAIEHSPAAADAGTKGEVAVIRSSLAVGLHDVAGATVQTQEAQRWLAVAGSGLWNDIVSLRGVAAFNQAVVYEMSGMAVAASEGFSLAIGLNREAANRHLVPACIGRMAMAQTLMGQLRQAAQSYRQSLREAKDMGTEMSPLAGVAHAGLGNILCEWNDLAEARTYLQAGIDLSERWQNWEGIASGYLGLARIAIVQGDEAGALARIDRIEQTAPAFFRQFAAMLAAAQRARLALHLGKVEQAAAWKKTCGLSLDGAPDYFTEPLYLILARVAIAQGDNVAEVLPLLERMQANAGAGGRTGTVMEILIVKSLALRAQGNPSAVATLEEALALAKPEGYVRIFADEGQAMAVLLGAVQAPALLGYARQLIAVTGAPQPNASSARPTQAEQLSPRELEVLRLLASGLSNQQIAGQCVVSENTVKTHIKNIYEKLAVSSRTQAVSKARELGLI
jgi:LuxR family maltose regulon positive regulatory protein